MWEQNDGAIYQAGQVNSVEIASVSMLLQSYICLLEYHRNMQLKPSAFLLAYFIMNTLSIPLDSAQTYFYTSRGRNIGQQIS